MDEFGDMIELVYGWIWRYDRISWYLEEKFKALSHTKINGLKKKISRLEEAHI